MIMTIQRSDILCAGSSNAILRKSVIIEVLRIVHDEFLGILGGSRKI